MGDVNGGWWTRGMGWRIGFSMRWLRTRYLAVMMEEGKMMLTLDGIDKQG